MEILCFPFGQLQANGYLVHNGVDAVAVDPPDNPRLVLDELAAAPITLRAILCTHGHFDHVYGCAPLQKLTDLPVLIAKEDWDMRAVLMDRADAFGLPAPETFRAEMLAEGDYNWGSLHCQVLHSPGHSPGSLCYFFPEGNILISGDVLFYRSVGRADLPGGNVRTLGASIRKLYELPHADQVTVYPGHGMETNLGEEARQNPYWRQEHA